MGLAGVTDRELSRVEIWATDLTLDADELEQDDADDDDEDDELEMLDEPESEVMKDISLPSSRLLHPSSDAMTRDVWDRVQ